ncbi:hypothetical protein [Psittacicella hinzii]|uniref:hypothetical protein n=1 Tax=Psittacicella hinzii TaxID=2028575 RepID=UPI001CA7B431|nr:hypothetical protein [Psittacicella hinzii]
MTQDNNHNKYEELDLNLINQEASEALLHYRSFTRALRQKENKVSSKKQKARKKKVK